jgi:hypothetical protein
MRVTANLIKEGEQMRGGCWFVVEAAVRCSWFLVVWLVDWYIECLSELLSEFLGDGLRRRLLLGLLVRLRLEVGSGKLGSGGCEEVEERGAIT